MKYLLGIDIGTSGTKAVLFDEKLKIIGTTDASYPLSVPKPLYAEQNPDDWFNATVDCIKKVIADTKINGSDVLGIGLSGQMHGLVILDKDNKVLRPSIIWCDQRTERECEEITKTIGKEKLISITANPALTGFTLSKILWVKNNERKIYDQIKHIMLPKDYVSYKLTGNYSTDVSDASGMQLLDVPKRAWSDEILKAFAIKKEFLPKLYESEEVVGKITKEMAELTGLSTNCVMVAGAGDQAGSAIGNGIVSEGIISDNLGSSGVVFAHTEKPLIDPKGRVHTFCHAVKGKWHVMGVTQGFGVSIKWFKDNFASHISYDELNKGAKNIKPGSKNIVFLPYLMGERTPHLNPNATGVFIGLGVDSDISAMYRSVLEGVCYSQKDCLKIINELGVNETEIRVSGGATKGDIVKEILADILESDIKTSSSSESGCMGVAILAGVGAKVFTSVEDACKNHVKFENTTKKTNKIESYNYDKFQKTYEVCKELF